MAKGVRTKVAASPTRVPGTLEIVTGGQNGSECKGHVTAQLAARSRVKDGLCIRVYGPNAGHVVIGPGPTGEHHEWKLRSVPVAAVSTTGWTVALAAGSEIDFAVLDAEVAALDAAGYRVSDRLVLDPAATVLEPHHIQQELDAGLNVRIGSTAKGIGAARAARIMRTARTVRDRAAESGFRYRVAGVAELARQEFRSKGHVLIEHAQGAGLSLHSDRYPFTTSADCRAIDALAAVGLSPWGDVPTPYVWVVFRTRPIRVAGNSGILKGETTFDQIGWETEYTTVTNRVRRIGEWDPDLARQAVVMNGGPASNVRVALMQWDKECPTAAGASRINDLSPIMRRSLRDWCARVRDETGATVQMVGTSPSTVVVSGANGFVGREGSDNPMWKDQPSYMNAHDRLSRMRGKAVNYLCAHCGKGAQQWAYDGKDPDQLKDANRHGNDIWYSQEPSHYLPLCRSCHAKFDGYTRNDYLAAGSLS